MGIDPQTLGVNPDAFHQAHAQGLIQCLQGRRRGVVQGPGKTLAAAIGVAAAHGLAQRPTNRCHADIGRHRFDWRTDAALAVAVGQHVMHLQHQRCCRRQAELPRYRRAIGPADPYANQVTRAHANRPGIAKAITGAGFPCQHRPLDQLGTRVAVGPRLAAEDAPHNPCGAGRQQRPLPERIVRL